MLSPYFMGHPKEERLSQSYVYSPWRSDNYCPWETEIPEKTWQHNLYNFLHGFFLEFNAISQSEAERWAWCMVWCNSCLWVWWKKKTKKGLSRGICLAERSTSLNASVFYSTLQLWGRNDFNSLHREQFHICKPTAGRMSRPWLPSPQRDVPPQHAWTSRVATFSKPDSLHSCYSGNKRARCTYWLTFLTFFRLGAPYTCLRCLQEQWKWECFTSAINRYFRSSPLQ